MHLQLLVEPKKHDAKKLYRWHCTEITHSGRISNASFVWVLSLCKILSGKSALFLYVRLALWPLYVKWFSIAVKGILFAGRSYRWSLKHSGRSMLFWMTDIDKTHLCYAAQYTHRCLNRHSLKKNRLNTLTHTHTFISFIKIVLEPCWIKAIW